MPLMTADPRAETVSHIECAREVSNEHFVVRQIGKNSADFE